jgi:hypothetical protein
MRKLCLVIEPHLYGRLIEGQSERPLDLDGCRFTQRATREQIIFYDWIADRAGAIHGLEIHLLPTHPALRTLTPFERLPHVEVGCFVRVWFSKGRDYFPLGKEAFGDIWFFEAKDGRLAIVVGIDEWLSQSERDPLLEDLRAEVEPERS